MAMSPMRPHVDRHEILTLDDVYVLAGIHLDPKFVRRSPTGWPQTPGWAGGPVLRTFHPCHGSPTPAVIGRRFFLPPPYDGQGQRVNISQKMSDLGGSRSFDRTRFPKHNFLLPVDVRPGREVLNWTARGCGNRDEWMPAASYRDRAILFNPQQGSRDEDQSQDGNEATHGRANFALPPRPGQGDADLPTDPRLGLGDSQEPFPGETASIHDCQLSS